MMEFLDVLANVFLLFLAAPTCKIFGFHFCLLGKSTLRAGKNHWNYHAYMHL